MNTQQQAYINGFVKRAADYGYNQQEALYILKTAANFPSNMMPNTPGSLAAPIASPVTGGTVPESLKTENQHNPMAGMMSGSNFYASPQPSQEPAPAPVPAPVSMPENPAGPSNAWLSKVMGSYDPKSRLDQQKANRIRQIYRPNMKPNEVYRDAQYSAIK